jgi:tyrosyl-tRNA synthetase
MRELTMTLSEQLEWRGFVNQTTLQDSKQLDNRKFTLYLGVDPSADSMTVGNLAAAMMVRHFIDAGHKVLMLVGGATGMIGDPGGKSEERNLQSLAQIAKNKAGIAAQYKQIFSGQQFTIVDNYDWLSKLSLLDFLRDTGKHFGMTTLLQRDFIAQRIGQGGTGISYTEFSYTLLQGYDYLYLHNKYGVDLQVCGADQWGNTLSGVDLIRKVTGDEVHAYSCPLVLNKSTGKKFGKSEGGAVWLDPNKTSVFDFYQFWLNVDDEGVLDYLKIFTLLSKEKIVKTIEDFKEDPASRLAQKTLAYEVTKLVHGKDEADKAVEATDKLFSGEASELTPTVDLPEGEYDPCEVIVKAGLATSNSAARRLFEQGGFKVNGQKIVLPTVSLKSGDLLQAGKRNFVKVK